jgi:putative peptidoglycan lipid II flippase
VGFAALGHVIAAVLFQAGRFGADDARYVWAILAGATIGLLATTQGRLYSSVFYALHDTRTPLRYAGLRVLLASALGYLAAVQLPPALGLAPRWGAAGITAATGLAGWVEFMLLRRSLSARIGRIHSDPGYLARLWGPAIVAGAVGWLILQAADTLGPQPRAVLVLVPFGIIYLLGTALLKVPQARGLIDRVRRRA